MYLNGPTLLVLLQDNIFKIIVTLSITTWIIEIIKSTFPF